MVPVQWIDNSNDIYIVRKYKIMIVCTCSPSIHVYVLFCICRKKLLQHGVMNSRDQNRNNIQTGMIHDHEICSL